ncbi:DNA methyltransferase [Dysgonomonas sp. Marseille-Q5470]|uniref:DNA methyltransferase n=1 Tax=Dysgonomonas sp. Marseille-Q5470 TaxID=3039494 RepID=UPI0024BC3647|nr:DNA methyltransferase [Dysgonomonas sp. Marseille-Q5470]
MKDFFEKIDFSFGTDTAEIKPNKIIISSNLSLSQKLEGNVFVYDSPQYTKSSFYVITIPLSDKELFELRRYIWNENKYDLYFLAEKPESNLVTTLFYAKTAPNEVNIKIASFNGSKEEEEELDKIKKHNFQTGAFWLHYSNLLNKIKGKKSIDEELVEQLKQLKDLLNTELSKQQIENPDEIVQALIDRTLFIKFLEDNHIINLFFYNYHFSDIVLSSNEVSYKTLLENNNINAVNKLFDLINQLFSNVLFESPHIDARYMTKSVMELICKAIGQYDWGTGQLSLFDFQFDVIPIEFISHIYEVFLEKTQLDEGIYYTPDKLAHLIIDDVITTQGTILDPSCGSGMFLVLAFRKLQELNPINSKDVHKIIQHKNNLIKSYIYGIEKSNTAWRLTVFSLYLEILKDIPAEDIKTFIQEKILSHSQSPIFTDFSDNIVNRNALELNPNKIPHQGKFFDYIVGNPPFFQIKSNNEEIKFINDYSLKIGEKVQYAKDIVGYNQISQAFMLKLKDWAYEKTQFGFIQNSSNFYNEKSQNFQEFFFSEYNVKSIYELSRVRDILFRKAKENVLVTIFNNKLNINNIVKYYPVYKVLFSSLFDLVIIQEDKRIDIPQKKILGKEIVLRDYLIGNNYDLQLINNLSKNAILEDFIIKTSSFKGAERATNKQVYEYFKLKPSEISNLSKDDKSELQNRFASDRYLKESISAKYNVPYLYKPENMISDFSIKGTFNGYMNIDDVNDENFQRPRKDPSIYQGEKILLNRFGRKIEAAYVNYDLIFSNLIYGIKLQDESKYYLLTAILNSDVVNFYVSLKFRKRVDNNYSNLDTSALKNIPIPCLSDKSLTSEITEIVQNALIKKQVYDKNKLNDLIYDLYDLSYLERQRIRDFSSMQQNVGKIHFEGYKHTMLSTLSIYFHNQLIIDIYENGYLGVDIVIVAIFLNNSDETMPSSEKTFKYILDKIVSEYDENITFLNERIIGKDCVYLIKDKQFQNWTETKAFEDGKDILKLMQP